MQEFQKRRQRKEMKQRRRAASQELGEELSSRVERERGTSQESGHSSAHQLSAGIQVTWFAVIQRC